MNPIRQMPVAAALLVLFAIPSAQADDLTVMLNNHAAQAVTAFIITPKDKTISGVNLLAASVAPGEVEPVTITGGSACLPVNKGGGPYAGTLAPDGSSIAWTPEKAADRLGYYITIHVA